MDIDQIKKAIKTGRINITEHADEELASENISNESLYHSVMNGEIIEDYPFRFQAASYSGKTKIVSRFTASGHLQKSII